MSKDELEMVHGQEIYSPLLIAMEIFIVYLYKVWSSCDDRSFGAKFNGFVK